MSGTRAKAIVGQRFGRLVVVSRSGSNRHRAALWTCACDCGGTTTLTASALKFTTKSCGCGHSKHGHAGQGMSPTYRSWHCMMSRCHNPNDPAYHRYGAVGIVVCERWRTFSAFLADMGERPVGTSVDRFPNGNGNYEPGNCRWATPLEQTRNRKTQKLTEAQVQEIHGRREHGESPRAIATRMSLSRAYVDQILRGQRWIGSQSGWSQP